MLKQDRVAYQGQEHEAGCACDGCLLAQMQSSDPELRKRGWYGWYERDGSALYAFVQRRCQWIECPEQSEDLLHDAFIVGFRNISSGRYVDQGRPLRAYLFGIAKHLVQEVKWRRHKEMALPEEYEVELIAVTPDLSDQVMVKQVLTRVQEAYHRQPELAQSVINGLYSDGKSSDEVAQQLERSAGSVRTIASRSVNEIRSYLNIRHELRLSAGAIRCCIEALW